MGRPVIERLMRALVVVMIDVAGDFSAGLLNVLAEVPYEFQVVMQLGYSFGVIQSCTM
jgi:hypothetical protein